MQTRDAVQAAWCTMSSADPSVLESDGLAELLSSITAVRSVCDAVEVLAVRRSRELNAAGASAPPESVLANETGRSGRDARTAANREQACEAMPAFETGLVQGRISSGHVDAAAGVHARLTDAVADEFADHAAHLVTRAGHVNVDVFERECRDLARHLTAVANRHAEADELERQHAASKVKRWVDRVTGMHNTLISLDPLRDAKMWKVINAQLARDRQRQQGEKRQQGATGQPGQTRRDQPLSFAALQANALVNTITASSAASGPSASVSGSPRTSGTPAIAELSVLFSYESLLDDLHTAGFVCETDDGTPLPPALVRQMACDAHIIPMILNSHGEVLDQGRTVRTATPQQRLTLAAMHATCAFPNCTIEFSACRIHHVKFWWKHLGPTNINNLIPLCEQHHHLVHDGGWELTLTTERIATWTRPDGQLHHHGTTINRRATHAERGQHRKPRDVPLRR